MLFRSNDTATTEIYTMVYTLSLHDALPISLGKLPKDGVVRFLPSDRRFDNFGRECVLVEYQGPDFSTIGWILIGDLKGGS